MAYAKKEDKMYVVYDKFTDQILTEYDRNKKIDISWDAGIDYAPFKDFDKSALFKTIEEAIEVRDIMEKLFIENGTPENEIEFVVLEMTKEIKIQLFFKEIN